VGYYFKWKPCATVVFHANNLQASPTTPNGYPAMSSTFKQKNKSSICIYWWLIRITFYTYLILFESFGAIISCIHHFRILQHASRTRCAKLKIFKQQRNTHSLCLPVTSMISSMNMHKHGPPVLVSGLTLRRSKEDY
jgi:hypothetical protein